MATTQGSQHEPRIKEEKFVKAAARPLQLFFKGLLGLAVLGIAVGLVWSAVAYFNDDGGTGTQTASAGKAPPRARGPMAFSAKCDAESHFYDLRAGDILHLNGCAWYAYAYAGSLEISYADGPKNTELMSPANPPSNNRVVIAIHGPAQFTIFTCPMGKHYRKDGAMFSCFNPSSQYYTTPPRAEQKTAQQRDTTRYTDQGRWPPK